MNKYTIKNFVNDFPDNDSCLEWLKNFKYSRHIFCNKCNKITKHHRIKNRTCYCCDKCGNQIYPMANTIFEKSTTPLKYWFYALLLIGSTKSKISAKELQRKLGVTYKTAWRISSKIKPILSKNI